mmetsp:Transcript_33552/g.52449  ORF Transcript_33552/g.52449 Transcript_33552/m.52449 type:complete len:117 (-) Transcript_33552:72-422(-)
MLDDVLVALSLDNTNSFYQRVGNVVLQSTLRKIDTTNADERRNSKTRSEDDNQDNSRAREKYPHGFTLFCELKTPKERHGQPNETPDEILQRVTERWNRLEDSLKERFEIKARNRT